MQERDHPLSAVFSTRRDRFPAVAFQGSFKNHTFQVESKWRSVNAMLCLVVITGEEQE
jgi:hypothetical protein